jgi:hypothetical protein
MMLFRPVIFLRHSVFFCGALLILQQLSEAREKPKGAADNYQ